MEQVDFMCGERYQEGVAPTRDTPTCHCGTFAVGKCAECAKDICGMHSGMNGGRRLCGACKQEETRKRAKAKAQADEEAARDRATWPYQTHADVVAELSVYQLDFPQRKKPATLTGAEMAMLLARAGVKARNFTRPKQGLFKPALSVQGWLMAKTDNSTNERHFDVDEEILAVDGSKWTSNMATWSQTTLEKCTEPTKIYPAGTVNQIYRQSDTYLERMKKWMHENERQVRAKEAAEREEARKKLLAD